MSALPDEIWSQILEGVPRQNLKKIRSTSHQIYRVGLDIYTRVRLSPGQIFTYKERPFQIVVSPMSSLFPKPTDVPSLKIVKIYSKKRISVVPLNREGVVSGKPMTRKVLQRPDGCPYIQHRADPASSWRCKYDLVY